MNRLFIVVIVMLLLSSLGCKKKSEEEKLEALYQKLDHAEGKEVDAILAKIDELSREQERAEAKQLRNVQLKLGQSFTVEETDPDTRQLITRYSIKFTEARYSSSGFANDDTMSYIVDYQYRNLGPRVGKPDIDKAEIKMRNGHIYSAFVGSYMPYRETRPGQQGDGRLKFKIPFDSIPSEVTGRVGDSQVGFLLSLSEVQVSKAEVEVPVWSVNPEKGIKVLRCYITGLGQEPHIHLMYQNIGSITYQVLLSIYWWELNRKFTGQEDLRGPIGPSAIEDLVYKLRVGSPEKILTYEIQLGAAPASGGGLPPPWWGPGRFPRVNPTMKERGKPLTTSAETESKNIKTTAAAEPAELAEDIDPSVSLQRAVATGDVVKIQSLLDTGADVNEKANNGASLLHIALLQGHQDVAALLISKGADTHATMTDGTTPLHFAVLRNCKDIVKFLLDDGVDVNALGTNLGSSLHIAANTGQTEIAEMLIEKGADVNIKNQRGMTPLAFAKQKGSRAMIELLEKHGAE